MRRAVRKVIILTLVALVVTLGACWPSFLRYAALRGLQQARSEGINMTWNGLSAGFSSVGLDSLTVWIPGPRVKGAFAIPVSVELQQLSLAVRPGSLLKLSPRVAFSTILYGGVLVGEGETQGMGASITATLTDIELGKHPQLSTLGVRGGVVNGAVENLHFIPSGVDGGTFSLQLRRLEPPSIDALTTLLRTRELGTVDVDAEGEVSASAARFSTVRLSSLFGSVLGELTVTNHLTPQPSTKGSFEISLSEKGVSILGPWLPLIPNAGLDATTSAFAISVTSVPCSAQHAGSSVMRFQFGCVKLGFSRR